MPNAAEIYLERLVNDGIRTLTLDVEDINSGTILSGQVTVTTAGTAVQGVDVPGNGFFLKAHPNNTDTVWVGRDVNGTVLPGTGFPLDNGETIFLAVNNLNLLFFNADVSGEKICFIRS